MNITIERHIRTRNGRRIVGKPPRTIREVTWWVVADADVPTARRILGERPTKREALRLAEIVKNDKAEFDPQE